MSQIINARSPYIIEINEVGQIETKVQLYIWNAGSPMPALPTHSMDKKIPATNNPATYYDIAPFIQEYIENYIAPNPSLVQSTPAKEWCNVMIKRFKKISTSFIQIGVNEYFYGVNGYGEYLEGSNPDLGNFLKLTYDNDYYNPVSPYNSITVFATAGDYVEYVDLISGFIQTELITSNGFKDIALVHPAWALSGNYFQYKNSSGALLYEQKMVPRDWCKYEPIRCDFINKLGGWETTWFYARSNDSLSKTASKYNFLMDESLDYNPAWGTQKTFNTNGVKSIKVNTDWVEEEYKLIIQQLLMSERIVLNGKQPVTLTTQSVELYKSIDTKMINYELNFDFAFNFINNVI
jgi:hypothetical protein